MRAARSSSEASIVSRVAECSSQNSSTPRSESEAQTAAIASHAAWRVSPPWRSRAGESSPATSFASDAAAMSFEAFVGWARASIAAASRAKAASALRSAASRALAISAAIASCSPSTISLSMRSCPLLTALLEGPTRLTVAARRAEPDCASCVFISSRRSACSACCARSRSRSAASRLSISSSAAPATPCASSCATSRSAISMRHEREKASLRCRCGRRPPSRVSTCA